MKRNLRHIGNIFMVLFITALLILTVGCSATPAPNPLPAIPSPAATAAPAPSSGASQSVTMDLTTQNMKFDKNTLSVPAGAQVTIVFTNKDTAGHNFALYTDKTAKTIVFKGEIINGTKTINYTFTAPAGPGTYYFQCDPHAGFMNGSFIVTN